MFEDEVSIVLKTEEDNTITWEWRWGSSSSYTTTFIDSASNCNYVHVHDDYNLEWSTVTTTNNLEVLQKQVDELSKKVEMLQHQSELVEEDDKGFKVETLPGGQGLGELADLEYFQQKLLRSLTKIGS